MLRTAFWTPHYCCVPSLAAVIVFFEWLFSLMNMSTSYSTILLGCKRMGLPTSPGEIFLLQCYTDLFLISFKACTLAAYWCKNPSKWRGSSFTKTGIGLPFAPSCLISIFTLFAGPSHFATPSFSPKFSECSIARIHLHVLAEGDAQVWTDMVWESSTEYVHRGQLTLDLQKTMFGWGICSPVPNLTAPILY